MNVLYLMDPLETVHPTKDTTLMLMVAAHRRSHDVYFLPDGGIHLRDGALTFSVLPVTPDLERNPPFHVGDPVILHQDQVDVVFIRKDPPFDDRYLMNTWLLDRLPASVTVINSASGVRTVNEKLWVTQFSDLTPPTLVTRDIEQCHAFIHEHHEAILKPLNGFGGQSIFHVRVGEINHNVILETLTQKGTQEIILQKFLPEAREGDKRILLLNGEPLGAVLRVQKGDDHRNNFMAGGQPQAAKVDAADKRILDALRKPLADLGLIFVGIDVIGEKLIEVNVTSPTCLQEMNRLYGKQLEDDVLHFVEMQRCM